MSQVAYLKGRTKYQRPQAMLWANNPGSVVLFDGDQQSYYVPNGLEIGSIDNNGDDNYSGNEFIILSDDNRKDIDFKPERIEKRERTINGRMRSYHIADKLSISTSWEMLPSRSASLTPSFDSSTGLASTTPLMYTTDGGAGGVELLDWYQNNTGSFWVYLSYDKYSNFGKSDAAYGNLGKYSQVVEVFFSSFEYSIVKRGGSNHDFWNVSVTLEEV